MTQQTNPTTLDLIKNKIKEFEKLQHELSRFGAADSEPDGVFQVQLVRAITGKEAKVPNDSHGWELYTGTKGVKAAAKRLHDVCRETVVLIQEAKVAEYKPIRDYLKDYCWRVTWVEY